MKLLKRYIESKNGAGTVILIPEEIEDLWHIYHIISIGDRIKCSTIRKISKETSTGSVASERLKITLTVQCEKTDFDPKGGNLRVSGKNVVENKFVKLGQYHTLDIEVNRKITIMKDCWDSVHLQTINDAIDVKKKADVAAVLMSDQGKARICLITSSMTLDRLNIEMSIPKKRYPGSHEKGVHRFFDAIIRGIEQNIDWEVIKCIIVASPGFTKDQFMEYITKNGHSRSELKPFLKNRDRFLLVHTSSAHRQVLNDILSDPMILKNMSDTKAAAEVQALNDFHKLLRDQPDRAFYGPGHVIKAGNMGAIETLLIMDELFRASDVQQRRQYVHLVESVKRNGGNVHIFSSLHASGDRLKSMTGVAAILRYPLPLEDNATDSETESDED
uniref:Protein pelota homolog n=1 Tax=Percolomonas cosmopolitus TaxID=63605 RepID=A0A7S1KN67_9EUKA|eukprot:CAMPEP_0117451200 /NCGR_PEP_ID=MMETSP0759-20121206/8882_1 /TAXON_ID=63605 /ORGANISM="Percolomonas cosmopolitus, Strain WS" /LENGTH=387 /DNA_ID=CAMNT_0005243787 /DNA_START=315 /DNA_END=1478 /DNA_ORIENTATION=-